MEPAPGFSVVFAPNRVDLSGKGRSIFLAGSIDKGEGDGVNWHTKITNKLSSLPVTILNPRRHDWNSSWEEDISYEPFREQVEWEQDMLEAADVIALYFSKHTPAPISLLELGLFARSGKMVVACPEGYWKRGNVQIICQRFNIELVDSIDKLVESVERKVHSLLKDANLEIGTKRVDPEKLSTRQREPHVSVSEVTA